MVCLQFWSVRYCLYLFLSLFYVCANDAFCVVCPPRKHEIDALMVFFFVAIARTTTDWSNPFEGQCHHQWNPVPVRWCWMPTPEISFTQQRGTNKYNTNTQTQSECMMHKSAVLLLFRVYALSVLFIRHSLAQIAMRVLGWLLALLKVKVYTAQQINENKIYFDSVTLHLAWLHLPFCRCAALILYIEHGAVCRMQYNYLLMAFFHCSSSDGMFSVQFVRVPCVLIVLPPHIHILIVITRLCEWSCR